MSAEILKDEKIRKILDRMRATCSVRERCTSEVREKVSKLLTEENMISAVVESLTEDGFLSDSRYAAAFARDKAHLLGWGPQKIRYALLSKKLDEATVNEALALVDDSASANQLERLLRRKLESLTKKSASHATDPSDEDCAATSRNTTAQTAIREKLIRFALGRGYTLDSTLAALSKLPL
ncbi:MAG: RecX family transcriptional regulator [Bacteroidales bacterium]|nr:RecX family transcriptional regulator [Bacteroidales bacterium]